MTIQEQINILTRELKDCTDDDRYERLWNERIELKEQQYEEDNRNKLL